MKIRVLAVGTRLPKWVDESFSEYSRRLPRDNQLVLEEIATPSGRREASRARDREGDRMLARVRPSDLVIALDERGEPWSSRHLAGRLMAWRQDGRDVAMLIGGPDGLAPACMERADSVWSLSALTFPHALARVIVAEQTYRAWTINAGHPYHRD